MLTYKKDDFDENIDDIMNSIDEILKNRMLESNLKDESDDINKESKNI